VTVSESTTASFRILFHLIIHLPFDSLSNLGTRSFFKQTKRNMQRNSVAIPTDRPPLVGEF
jgi:hypothetical protein